MMKIGLTREGKVPVDERVPLSPEQCAEVMKAYPEVEIMVETSPVRRFRDEEYEQAGIKVVKSLLDCDVIFGVKEVPVEQLLARKTYFFFSHTIKKQPYNRELLQAVVKKKIRLVDYECLRDKTGRRLIGFGRYAGIVGAYNGILAYGKRFNLFSLKPAHLCANREELHRELRKVKLPNVKIAITGRGRVAMGAMEILDQLHVPQVTAYDYLDKTFDHPVYVQLSVTDYNKRKDGKSLGMRDFFEHPEDYESNFLRFALHTDLYISGHFWKEGSPYIFTRSDAKLPGFKIKVVADISCDINGPVACTLRPSTIQNPLYGYHPGEGKEVDFMQDDCITVMAVDNLPCELPRDASEGFGRELIDKVLPHVVRGDKKDIVRNATIAENGRLTKPFGYLQDYLEGR